MDYQLRMSRLLAVSALLWMIVGVGVAVYLEVVYAGSVDPVRATFSEYVNTEQGARLVGVAMLGVAFSSFAVAGSLWCAGGPRSRAAYWLIVVWGLGMVALAVFPQEPADQSLTWHGAIHRYAALAGMITLPAAGLVLADRWPVLRRLGVAGLLLLAVFVATFLYPDLRAYSGIVERVLLVTDLAIIGVLIRALHSYPHSPSTLQAR